MGRRDNRAVLRNGNSRPALRGRARRVWRMRREEAFGGIRRAGAPGCDASPGCVQWHETGLPYPGRLALLRARSRRFAFEIVPERNVSPMHRTSVTISVYTWVGNTRIATEHGRIWNIGPSPYDAMSVFLRIGMWRVGVGPGILHRGWVGGSALPWRRFFIVRSRSLPGLARVVSVCA